MIITRTEKGENVYTRENWKEWFTFVVSYSTLKTSRFNTVPKGYVLTSLDDVRRNQIYWFWCLVPFVKILYVIRRKWWDLACWFADNELMNLPEEGAAISWFWVKYLGFKKVVNRLKFTKNKKNDKI